MRTIVAEPAKRLGALAAILVLVLATMAVGCSEKESRPETTPIPPPLPGYLPPTSPENVIANLEKSWTELNYEGYESVLNDSFVSDFSPLFIAPPDTPPSWGKSDDLLMAQHLFSKTAASRYGYVTDRVTLSFTVGPEIPNDMDGWTKIVLSQVFLTLKTHNHVTGDSLDYVVQGDEARLWFVENAGVWTLVRWEDVPMGNFNAGPGVQGSTWVQIKEMFR